VNTVVKSGEQVLFYLRIPGQQPLPVMATVLKVQLNAIVVAEMDSRNGLAEINIISSSKADGTYDYIYYPLNEGLALSFNITKLLRLNGEKIMCDSFIEE